MGVNLKFSCSQGCLVVAYTWKCWQRSRCTHTMRARMFVSVAVCVSRKLRPCPSYSGRRDRNNSVHWCSSYKGGGYKVWTKTLKVDRKCRSHKKRKPLLRAQKGAALADHTCLPWAVTFLIDGNGDHHKSALGRMVCQNARKRYIGRAKNSSGH